MLPPQTSAFTTTVNSSSNLRQYPSSSTRKICVERSTKPKMSLTINAQLFGKLECRMDDLRAAIAEGDMGDAQKMMERMMKAFAEIRGTSTAVAAAASEEAPAKGKKSRKTKDGEPKVKREVKPGSWADQLKTIYMPVFNKAWEEIAGAEKRPLGLHMKVCGYVKNQIEGEGKKEPTLEEMKQAITFFKENPDYESKTAQTRSADGSTDEAPKARGRPKKKAAEKPVSAPVVVPKAEESDDEDSDEEEEEDMPPLASFEFKGQNYLKDPLQECYTSEGKPEWVGTFDGKKIRKNGEMPAHVKKVLKQME